MFINEVCKKTKLTKKAIEYYMTQGLIFPSVAKNGYREFCDEDVKRLNGISALRKLDVSTDDIKRILVDKSNNALQTIYTRRELELKRDAAKKMILQKLCQGADYCEISEEINAIEQSKSIVDRLLEVFPGYYGRFIAMHFARFLCEPIKTQEQQDAYDTIIAYLDNLPLMELPTDLKDYLDESTKSIGAEQISEVLESTKKAYENPDEFFAENRNVLEWYMEYRRTDEYQASPVNRFMVLMKELNNSNGYNDIFIPAMKRLSPFYAEYYQQLETANKIFLTRYPETEK